jgi:putative ABC transport system permease protein
VAADIKNQGLQKDPQAQLYLPFPQLPWSDMNLLVRTDVAPSAAVATVRNEIAAVDGNQPVNEIQTAEELIDSSRAQPRFTMLLIGGFSGTALLLAIVGVYGVLSYSIGQRRQEFGIRLALGAQRADIRGMVMRQGMMLALTGIAAGLVVALIMTRLLENVLYRTGARDLATFFFAPVVFLLVAALASYIPARRAMSVEPVETLR